MSVEESVKEKRENKVGRNSIYRHVIPFTAFNPIGMLPARFEKLGRIAFLSSRR